MLKVTIGIRWFFFYDDNACSWFLILVWVLKCLKSSFGLGFDVFVGW